MNKDTDKLAVEMQNLKPSKASRTRGMDAAMAAFDAEFETVSENISDTPQGLEAAPRPTGQSTHTGRVPAFGRSIMDTLTKIFEYSPRKAMMGGSALAAIMAAMIFIPAINVNGGPNIGTPAVPTPVVDVKDPVPGLTPAPPKVGEVTLPGASEAAGSETSIPVTPRDVVKPTDIPPLAAPVPAPVPSSDPAPVTEAAPERAPTTIVKTPDTYTDLPPNTIVVERRVVKTPARTQERVVPSVTKMETRRIVRSPGVPTGRMVPAVTKEVSRRVIKTPAATQERMIPAVMRQMTHDFPQADGSVKTVTATVVVQEASTELVTVPPTYETVTETVVVQPAGPEYEPGTAVYETVSEPIAVQEASTELVTIPATFETVTEVIQLQADGSLKVLSSDVVAPKVAAVAEGGITSVGSLLSDVEAGGYADTVEMDSGKMGVSMAKPPAKRSFLSDAIPASSGDEVVVTSSRAEAKIASPSIAPPKSEPSAAPLPQSGQLTAGDYDDVLNPDLYKIYLDKMLQGPLKGKELPYVDADQRINIRVLDRLGKPVPMADITLTSAGRKNMFPLRTGADGMAYLYPEFDGLEPGVKLKVSVKGGRSVRKTLTKELIQDGGDIVVDLRTNRQPLERLDLLLTIDATGSMGDEMRYLQSELKAIVGRVEEANPGIDIRTGLIVYRDKGDEYVVREIPFTDDLEDFRASLSAQTATGGGNFPEAMHSAMEAALDMDWRDDAIKVNLLVADAPPHDKHIGDTWKAGLFSRTEGIHIVPLAASGVDKSAEFLMRAMAQMTGGRFLFLTDDSGIGNAHAEPTVDCYVVSRLDGLVTRVLSSLIKGERVEPTSDDVIRSVGNYRAGTCAVDVQDIEVSPTNVKFKFKQ